jgi:hypothetical protein
VAGRHGPASVGPCPGLSSRYGYPWYDVPLRPDTTTRLLRHPQAHQISLRRRIRPSLQLGKVLAPGLIHRVGPDLPGDVGKHGGRRSLAEAQRLSGVTEVDQLDREAEPALRVAPATHLRQVVRGQGVQAGDGVGFGRRVEQRGPGLGIGAGGGAWGGRCVNGRLRSILPSNMRSRDRSRWRRIAILALSVSSAGSSSCPAAKAAECGDDVDWRHGYSCGSDRCAV